MKVAIVYDRVNKWGGAERVLLALHEIFPKAPLYTSVYDKKRAPWAKVFPKVHTSFLQNIPFAKSNHEFLGTFMPLAYESFSFDEYDLVISVTSEAAKGIKTNSETRHICYCLTPTRYLWNAYDFYFRNPPPKLGLIPFFRFISMPIVWYLRIWDKNAAKRPDHFVAISTEVKRRIKKYYDRDSQIVFPPVNFASKFPKKEKGDYFLIVGRLVPYKRVDLAIKVFNKLDIPLYVVGSGSEEKKLRKMAGRKTRFFVNATNRKVAELYSHTKALVMPQEEDFGIVSVEAQSYGVPVIAYKKGGAADTVIDGKTGILFDKQTVESLTKAVEKFEKTKFVVDNLYTNAMRFSKDIFREQLLALVNKYR
jgi:glycosyltransferase involved in cell wall biosynthesis